MLGLWKILAIGLATFIHRHCPDGDLLFLHPGGFSLNWGTLIAVLGIFILIIAMLKFRSKPQKLEEQGAVL